MQLHPRMKAGLLLLAIGVTVIATGQTAQARHWRGRCCGGWGYGGCGGCGGYAYGGCGGCGCGIAYGGCGGGCGAGYGGCAGGACGVSAYNGYYYGGPTYTYGNGYGNTYTYAPNGQPMYANQAPPMSAGGYSSTTSGYAPSAPMPPGGYNGTTYDGGATPTYAPGTTAQPTTGQQGPAANPNSPNSPPPPAAPNPSASSTPNQ
ncbi:MAG TPA: hypothetical protein VEI07_01690 [Planctomycetaceae bacterium]|nr:hypothetical protein [Planctomycetaceae bacterium]